MRKLHFNQNNIIVKNKFSNIFKEEIKNMLSDYLKNYYNVPIDFKVFDKEISDLIIRIQENEDIKKTHKLKKNRKFKYTSSKTPWKGYKLIK